MYRRSPHFVIFGAKGNHEMWKITNSGDCFKYKTPKWVQNFSKVPFFCLFSWNFNFWKSKYNCYIHNIHNKKKIRYVIFFSFQKIFRKISWFFLKSWICKEFTKLRPETESQICEGHELWNHEMRGPPASQIGLKVKFLQLWAC